MDHRRNQVRIHITIRELPPLDALKRPVFALEPVSTPTLIDGYRMISLGVEAPDKGTIFAAGIPTPLMEEKKDRSGPFSIGHIYLSIERDPV